MLTSPDAATEVATFEALPTRILPPVSAASFEKSIAALPAMSPLAIVPSAIIVLVTVPLSPVVTTVPVVAGKVIVVVPASAGVTRVTVPEVEPAISIPVEPTSIDAASTSPPTVRMFVLGLYEIPSSVYTLSSAAE